VRNGEVKRIGNLSQGWATAGVDVTVRPSQDLDRVRSVILATTEQLAKEEPWNERLWGPVEILGLDAVQLDSVTVRLSAKTMPGQSLRVERELRWRIKQAFDAAGIALVGGAVPLVADEAPDPAAAVAPPSALASPSSAESAEASPLPSQQPNVSK
jgi:small conductance mechanosensitive channel